VSRDFQTLAFFIKQYPQGPWFTGKTFFNSARIRRVMIDFRTHEIVHAVSMTTPAQKLLLGSPFKSIYIFSDGVWQFWTYCICFWYICPLKAARAVRIVHWLCMCMRCHILHALPMTSHAPVYPVSTTPYAFLKIRISSRIWIYIRKDENNVTLSLQMESRF
jgi:hypothetical protein